MLLHDHLDNPDDFVNARVVADADQVRGERALVVDSLLAHAVCYQIMARLQDYATCVESFHHQIQFKFLMYNQQKCQYRTLHLPLHLSQFLHREKLTST